jgi:hypothetical protein
MASSRPAGFAIRAPERGEMTVSYLPVGLDSSPMTLVFADYLAQRTTRSPPLSAQ